MLDEIEAFISRLRDRPWIDPALVDVIARGLRTAEVETILLGLPCLMSRVESLFATPASR
jgi:hypothetical protein